MNDFQLADAGDAYSISEVARAAGVSSRTLRHYDHIGLLQPSWTADNGYRFYEQQQLVRLQRILLLRQLGLKLETIGEVLDEQQDETVALQKHITELRNQRTALDAQINAIKHTIHSLKTGETMNVGQAFEGFNEQYKDEVVSRWGEDSYIKSDQWWRGQSKEQRTAQMQLVKDLNEKWIHVGRAGMDPTSEQAQQIAAEHVAWLNSIPGTPGHDGDEGQLSQYVLGLAEMYVADERFAKNYEGQAPFVKASLEHFMQK
ncbi:MerR family transcriptional regulator [Glutamicibacter arilaitensis]|uniref:MerR family transcriptional regulator n=1 Tax=Glutamicibacter arilaitensis TaxID=256701 RepID=UPI0038504BCD